MASNSVKYFQSKKSRTLRYYALYDKLRNRVYYLTFIAYGMLHLSRKCYANLKIQLEKDAGFDTFSLSMMDTLFMLFYAGGSFFSGSLGSLYKSPTIVAIGLFGSGLSVMMLAIFIWMHISGSNLNPKSVIVPLTLWLIHGLMQSTGGPANTSIMSNWFGSKNRGYIFGTWTCHQYVGNIFAALLAGLILSNSRVPWTLALVIPAVANIIWGFVCLFFLPERPEDMSASSDARAFVTELSGTATANMIPAASDDEPSITFREAICIPNVIGYSLAFGLFKFINYTIFFWLPFFLAQSFNPHTSNLISILYDIGMIPGGILVGTISDIYGGRRACVIATFTITLLPFLLLFAEFGTLTTGMPTVSLMMLLGFMGCLIGGPINIITSAVAVDLSEHSRICGRTDLMTVTGIINGLGAVIASLGLACVGPVQQAYGWKYVWYLLAVCIVVGTLLLSPIIMKEITRPSLLSPQVVHNNDPNQSGSGISQTTDHQPPNSYQNGSNHVYGNYRNGYHDKDSSSILNGNRNEVPSNGYSSTSTTNGDNIQLSIIEKPCYNTIKSNSSVFSESEA